MYVYLRKLRRQELRFRDVIFISGLYHRKITRLKPKPCLFNFFKHTYISCFQVTVFAKSVQQDRSSNCMVLLPVKITTQNKYLFRNPKFITKAWHSRTHKQLSGYLSSNKWFAVCSFGTHRLVWGVKALSGSLSSNKWFVVCTFGTQTFVWVVKCLSGSLSSPKWFAVCNFGTHTFVWVVKCLSGSLSSNKWFAVYTFGTHMGLRGGMSKWFAQFK